MAINFPTSPTNGQTHTENGSSWEYSVDEGGVWITVPQTVTGPTGPAGADGSAGPAGNVAIGTTTTGAEGTSATVTNSGNGTHAVLNFTVPRGNTGAARPLSIAIEYPTNAEKVPFLYTRESFTIKEIRSVVMGTATPNVTFSVRYDANIQATGTEVVTNGIICTNVNFGLATTSFNNATVPANNWVYVTTSAQSGTVWTLAVTLII